MKTFKISKKHFNIFLVALLMIGSLPCSQIVQADETPPKTDVTVEFRQASLQFTKLPNFDFGRKNQFSSSGSKQVENQIKVINNSELIISSPDAQVPFKVSVKSLGTYVLGLKDGMWTDLSNSASSTLTDIWKDSNTSQSILTSGTLSLVPSGVKVNSSTTRKVTKDSSTTDNLEKPDLSLVYFLPDVDNSKGGTSQDIWSTSGEGFPGSATIFFPGKDNDTKTQIKVNNGSAYSKSGDNIEKQFLEKNENNNSYKEVVLVFPLAWNAAVSADDQVAQE